MKAADLPRVPGIPRTPLWSGIVHWGPSSDRAQANHIIGYLYDLGDNARLEIRIDMLELGDFYASVRHGCNSEPVWALGVVPNGAAFAARFESVPEVFIGGYSIPLSKMVAVFSAINAVVPS